MTVGQDLHKKKKADGLLISGLGRRTFSCWYASGHSRTGAGWPATPANATLEIALHKHLFYLAPNIIRISGTCNEAALIDDFNQITLVGNPGASINGPTPAGPCFSVVDLLVRSRGATDTDCQWR